VADISSGSIALYEHLDEIESLAARFADCSLPCVEWTHRAHLTVGLWTLREYAPDAALRRIRVGIQRYNAACGVVTTPTRGYHETITCFYMRMIGHYLAMLADRADWLAATNGLLDRYGGWWCCMEGPRFRSKPRGVPLVIERKAIAY